MKRAAGFTLIEVLVAVLAFGLLASIAYSSLDQLSAAGTVTRERAEAFAELQRAVATLDSDLRQIVGRLGRDRDGRLMPALSGSAETLLGRRAGRDNPAGLPRSQLQQFRWSLDPAGGLRREVWPDAVADPRLPPAGVTGFGGFEALRFRYLDAQGGWHPRWPVGGRPDAMPRAIEVRLESGRFGVIRRLLTL